MDRRPLVSPIEVLAVLLAITCCACGPMSIITRRPARRAPFAPGESATLVMTTLVSTMPGKARDPRYAEIPERMGRLFAAEGAHIVEERDLTGVPGAGVWLLRVELSDMHSGSSSDVSVFEFEVSAYDASGAPVERVATESGIVLMLDTTGRPPVLRETYEVQIAVDYGSRGSSAEERESFDDEYSQTLAALIYQRLAPDLARAISTATPFVQPVEALPATSGDDAVMPTRGP